MLVILDILKLRVLIDGGGVIGIVLSVCLTC